MKIRFLKSHPAYGYFSGDEAEVNDPKELLEGKFAEPVEIKKETAESNTIEFKIKGTDLVDALKNKRK